MSDIIVKGAREHNLQNVNLVLPRNQLICFTGVSGSGKSSLAAGILYFVLPGDASSRATCSLNNILIRDW